MSWRDEKGSIIAVAAILVIFAGIFVLAKGLISIEDEGRRVNLVYGEDGLKGVIHAGGEVYQGEMRAMVKGSIYMTGEYVSVFGTCLNSTDGGFPNTYGTLSAWYPNGTQFLFNQSMQELQTGYFLYAQYLSPIKGTYLTEFTCHVNNSNVVSKAFGEWQFPEWVQRINDSLTAIERLNDSLAQAQNNTYGWFEQTWTLINETSTNVTTVILENISEQLTYVAYVANASVDRNDSYLAQLLLSIAYTVQAPITGELNTEFVAERPRYRSNWRIEIEVTNEYNQTVGEPIVYCYINHTNSVPAYNQQMYYWDTTPSKLFSDKRTKIFYWDEFVDRLGEYNWTYWCQYNENIFIPS